MCVSVVVGDVLCETIDELRKAIFPKKPIISEGYGLPIPGNCCLCPVDIGRTAEMLGMAANRDVDGDPMRYLFTVHTTESSA